MPTTPRDAVRHGWPAKFRHAFRGVWLAVRDQTSFYVHGPLAAAVVVVALLLRVSITQWGLLILCISTVLAAEMFNTALEWLAKAVDRQENPHIGGALDIASAAVLTSAVGAALAGAALFLHRLAVTLSWWPL